MSRGRFPRSSPRLHQHERRRRRLFVVEHLPERDASQPRGGARIERRVRSIRGVDEMKRGFGSVLA